MDIDDQLDQYTEQLTDLTNAALNGEVSESEFIEQATAIVTAAFIIAYLIGGGDPARQEQALREELQQTLDSVELLADDIYSGRYSEKVDGDKVTQTAERGREMIATRLVLWATALLGIYHLGQVTPAPQTAAQVRNLVWVWTPEKQHCRDCRALNGAVLTPEEWGQMWARFGIRPQSSRLECRGFYCGCRFRQTDEPSIGIENVISLLRGV